MPPQSNTRQKLFLSLRNKIKLLFYLFIYYCTYCIACPFAISFLGGVKEWTHSAPSRIALVSMRGRNEVSIEFFFFFFFHRLKHFYLQSRHFRAFKHSKRASVDSGFVFCCCFFLGYKKEFSAHSEIFCEYESDIIASH